MDSEEEKQWSAEFEGHGETWLRDELNLRTFWAAVAAVIVGIIGVAVTLLH
jgi:hypothetical protein